MHTTQYSPAYIYKGLLIQENAYCIAMEALQEISMGKWSTDSVKIANEAIEKILQLSQS